jgi:uncharacterized membrane protein
MKGANGNGQSADEVVIGSYSSYEEAERVADALADRGLVEHVWIVARDVVIVEEIVGRMTSAKAALYGGSVGAILGLTLGALFGLLDWYAPGRSAILLTLWGLGLGAVNGAIVGVIDHWAHHGTRDFETVTRLEAGTYDVVSDREHAEQASRILREAVGAGAAAG